MSDTILPNLARLAKVPLRQVWANEAQIFTPWLERQENLDLLAESLGLSTLQIHAREHRVGRCSADILCRIGDGSDYLLIENQIEISDHSHLGQLLTYIAGLEAQDFHIRYVAWLAEDFRDEHRVAIEWLNDHLDDRVGFFACRIEVWQIGSSTDKAPRFDVIMQPRQISTMPVRVARRSEPNAVDINRVAYWAAFAEELRTRNLPLKIRQEPPRIGFYTFTLDSSRGLYLYAYRNVAEQSIGAYVGIAHTPAPIPRLIFETWKRDRSTIEAQFGAPLDWREIDVDANYHVQVDPTRGDPLDESDWPRQHKWLADQIERLFRAFDAQVRALPSKEELISRADPSQNGT